METNIVVAADDSSQRDPGGSTRRFPENVGNTYLMAETSYPRDSVPWLLSDAFRELIQVHRWEAYTLSPGRDEANSFASGEGGVNGPLTHYTTPTKTRVFTRSSPRGFLAAAHSGDRKKTPSLKDCL